MNTKDWSLACTRAGSVFSTSPWAYYCRTLFTGTVCCAVCTVQTPHTTYVPLQVSQQAPIPCREHCRTPPLPLPSTARWRPPLNRYALPVEETIYVVIYNNIVVLPTHAHTHLRKSVDVFFYFLTVTIFSTCMYLIPATIFLKRIWFFKYLVSVIFFW